MKSITYLKCPHGKELRSLIACRECEKAKQATTILFDNNFPSTPKRTPIYRGCNSIGGCFCSGRCKEIIGYEE